MFATRLKELRQRDSLSQVELASKLGLRQSAISAWEIGRNSPNFDQLKELSAIFDVSIDYLLQNDTIYKSPQISLDKNEENLLLIYSRLKKRDQQLLISLAKSMEKTK